MTSTTFTSRSTIIPASWLNDVNDFVYEGVIPGGLTIPVASGGTGATTAVGARTNLGLAIGTDVQAYDIELQALAGLTSAADTLPYFTGFGTAALTGFTSAGRALVDDANASDQRTTLGLGTIATQNANSVSISGGSVTGITDLAVADGGTGASDASTARTNLGLGTIATQNANNVSISGGSITGITDLAIADGGTGSSTAANARTALGLVIGTDVQAHDTDLDALAGLTSAANKGIMFTGSGTAGTYDLTAAGLALLDDASASAQRTTLGLGTIATQDANNVSISGGSVTGIIDITVADGGTGVSTMTTAYAPVCAGTTATGALQVASSDLSNSGYVLTSTGASSLPTWQAAAGGTDMVGDSGSGGVHGLAPAPAAGDAAAGKYLKADGTWTTPPGSGDMVLAAVQTVTGAKTFGTIGGAVGKFILAGSTSGSSILNAAAVAGTTTLTLQGTTGTIYSSGGTDVPVTDGGTGASDASGARTNLGLVIGTDVQAYDADLTTLSTSFTSASSSGPASLALFEDTDNGTNKVTLIAPASIASDKTATLQDVTGTLYVSSGTDVALADGGTGASLSDPNADRIMFWDDSAGAVDWLTAGTGLTITGTTINASAAGLTASAVQVFTADGTYTPTSGMQSCLVYSTGGGGGGGGSDNGDTTAFAMGGGGGAGGTCIEWFAAATIGASQAVTIGAGGTAGSATGGDGGTGGNTTLGSLHTATGGSGGKGATDSTQTFGTGGAGGVPTNGLLNVTGGAGGIPGVFDIGAAGGSARNSFLSGGNGGSSLWGGGGLGASVSEVSSGTTSTAGSNGSAYGSGGGGAITHNNTTGQTGGVGKAGVIVILEFI